MYNFNKATMDKELSLCQSFIVFKKVKHAISYV